MSNHIALGPTNEIIDESIQKTSSQLTNGNIENNNNQFVDEVMINNKKVLSISIEH